MALICTQAPLVNPVSLSELKEMLRISIDDTSQDSVLNGLNTAATSWCETLTQRRFVEQTWTLMMDFFPGYIDLKLAGQKVSSPFVSGSNAVLVGIRYAVVLPFPPVRSLNSFIYQNANGAVTSLIVGPVNISNVTNTIGQNVKITTSTSHNLLNAANVDLSGNPSLLALCNGIANQTVTVLDNFNFYLTYINGTGTSIPAEGQVTGFNFVEDLQSQPARLMPIFGQMWPVARVIANAVQMNYTIGYASPISVSLTAGNAVISSATFLESNIGQPISIPGAGWNGGTLNTIIQSVDGSGNGSVRDLPSTSVPSVTALLVDQGSPQHWELIKTAVKFLVSSWFINRVPSYDPAQRDVIASILGSCMDKRI